MSTSSCPTTVATSWPGSTGTARCSASRTRSPVPGSRPAWTAPWPPPSRGSPHPSHEARRGGRPDRPDHGQVTARYGDAVTSGVIRDAGLPETSRVASVGRPSWWAMAVSLVVAGLVTADLLTVGWLERMDLRVAETVGGWGLQDSDAYPLVWLVTQVGGRATILVVLAVLVGYLAWR